VALVVTESSASPESGLESKGLKPQVLCSRQKLAKRRAVGVRASAGSSSVPGTVSCQRCCRVPCPRSRGVCWVRRCSSGSVVIAGELFCDLFFIIII